MLDSLKFVKGAVARKDYVPALTFFRIKKGRVQGFNGSICLSSPIKLDIECNPKAITFIKAIETCKDTVELHLTPAQRLAVRSGPYTAYIECLPDDGEYSEIEPDGEEVEIDGEKLLRCFQTLEPFISRDASRPWSRGILLRGGSAYATNNVILVEKWIGSGLPDANIPQEAVSEITRIGIPPSKLQGNASAVTFHFPDGRWLRSQLLTNEWPDVGRILNQPERRDPIPTGFFQAITDLIPFEEPPYGCAFFFRDKISTTRTEGSGASITIPGIPEFKEGGYNLRQLALLEPIVTHIHLSFPEPTLFYGDELRGAISGMNV